MAKLARRRPVFHSEADLQHELAWELRHDSEVEEVRVERPFSEGRSRRALDLAVRRRGAWKGIELKYQTRRLQCELAGETFDLANQAAQDIRRYDFWKDVARLEDWTRSGRLSGGAVVLLTNDSGFWAEGNSTVVDAAFRAYEGRTVLGSLRWTSKASAGTTKGRSEPIALSGRYQVRWNAFSTVGSAPSGEFRYILLAV